MADKPFKSNGLHGAYYGSNSNGAPREEFEATAYCITGISKSGAPIKPGHVAADPKVIPLGSMIYVDSPLMGGIYQVKDTGELVKGKIIDIFIPSYERCKAFGRRAVKVQVLRYGFLGYGPEKGLPQ
jgi:3D (Asp-Asp-Asp) domain-containing protein